jgi:hypothetical protein
MFIVNNCVSLFTFIIEVKLYKLILSTYNLLINFILFISGCFKTYTDRLRECSISLSVLNFWIIIIR